jgi:hypothetical protein
MTNFERGAEFLRVIPQGRRLAYFADEVRQWYWVTRPEVARFWVLLDGASALEGWWYHSTHTRTPSARAAEKTARRAKTVAAAAAYTAARCTAEQMLRCLSPVQRGHWSRFCSHYTENKPAPVGGWDAYYGQEGGTVGKDGLPAVAAQGALRRASKAAGAVLRGGTRRMVVHMACNDIQGLGRPKEQENEHD